MIILQADGMLLMIVVEDEEIRLIKFKDLTLRRPKVESKDPRT